MSIKKCFLAGILVFSGWAKSVNPHANGIVSPEPARPLNSLNPFFPPPLASDHYNCVDKFGALKPCHFNSDTTALALSNRLNGLLQSAPVRRTVLSGDPFRLEAQLRNTVRRPPSQWLVLGYKHRIFLCSTVTEPAFREVDGVALSLFHSAFCYDFDDLNHPPKQKPYIHSHNMIPEDEELFSSIEVPVESVSMNLSFCYKSMERGVFLKWPENLIQSSPDQMVWLEEGQSGQQMASVSTHTSTYHTTTNCSDYWSGGTCREVIEVGNFKETKTALLEFLASVPVVEGDFPQIDKIGQDSGYSFSGGAELYSGSGYHYNGESFVGYSLGGDQHKDTPWSPWPTRPLPFDGIPVCAPLEVDPLQQQQRMIL